AFKSVAFAVCSNRVADAASDKPCLLGFVHHPSSRVVGRLALGILGDGAASVTAPFAIARKRHRLVKRAKIMLRTLNCPVIALEEHYWDKELAALFVGVEGVRDPEILKRLYDLGELRLREMDEAGIDVQILSHGAPSAQRLGGADAVELTRRVNDRLHAGVTANSRRFAGFAALPTSEPKAAGGELERATNLG